MYKIAQIALDLLGLNDNSIIRERIFMRIVRFLGTCCISMIALFPVAGVCLNYSLSGNDQKIVGEPKTIVLQQGETLTSMSRQQGVGYYEILEANPQLDPSNLQPGTEILLPTQFILPDAPHRGVVINLAELRLYLYSEDGKSVETVPVGIGRQGWSTPTGFTVIKDRREHPTWTVPTSVKVDMARRGVILPAQVGPGPDNPLGDHAMRLGMVGYVIHGTNRPEGVGRRTSAGCIRMFPEDVKKVFEQVEIGTPVAIINQPYKTAWQDDNFYFEAHQPLHEQRERVHERVFLLAKREIKHSLVQKNRVVNWDTVRKQINEHNGIPHIISDIG